MQIRTLDVRGLRCPLPALLARRAIARAAVGCVVEVLTDDPLAMVDLAHMCKEEGYEIVEMFRNSSMTRFILRRPG